MRRRLQRFSFLINKHLYLICFACASMGIAIMLGGMLSSHKHASLGTTDGILIIALPLAVTFGFYFCAREFEQWSIQSLAPKHPVTRDTVEGGEGAYEAAEFAKTRLPKLHDENHWTEQDDRELKRRMQNWKEKH